MAERHRAVRRRVPRTGRRGCGGPARADLVIVRAAEGRVSIVDAHVHVWDPRALTYPWLEDAGGAAAPHLPDAIDRAHGQSTRMVFVQADCLPEQSVAEVRWVAESAWPELAGVVAAADLRGARL